MLAGVGLSALALLPHEAVCTERDPRPLYTIFEASSVPRSSGVLKISLRYADQQARLDLYRPAGEGLPGVILLPDSEDAEGAQGPRFQRMATDLRRDGALAVVVHYHDTPQDRWLDTCVEAVEFVQRLDGIEQLRVGLIGFSEGGTLALQAAAAKPILRAVALREAALPENFSQTQARHLPALYFITGDKDLTINTFRTLQSWLRDRDASRPFEWHIQRGYGHFMPEDAYWEGWEKIRDFIRRRVIQKLGAVP